MSIDLTDSTKRRKRRGGLYRSIRIYSQNFSTRSTLLLGGYSLGPVSSQSLVMMSIGVSSIDMLVMEVHLTGYVVGWSRIPVRLYKSLGIWETGVGCLSHLLWKCFDGKISRFDLSRFSFTCSSRRLTKSTTVCCIILVSASNPLLYALKISLFRSICGSSFTKIPRDRPPLLDLALAWLVLVHSDESSRVPSCIRRYLELVRIQHSWLRVSLLGPRWCHIPSSIWQCESLFLSWQGLSRPVHGE